MKQLCRLRPNAASKLATKINPLANRPVDRSQQILEAIRWAGNKAVNSPAEPK
jgi:hypothetical protein